MISKLQVENYYILEASFKANLDFNTEKKVEVSIGVSKSYIFHATDPKRFAVTMGVIIEPSEDTKKKNYPWEINVIAEGFFQFNTLLPSDNEVQKYITLNAMPILYSLIRGYIAQTTSLGPNGRFMMPTLDFRAMADTEESPTPPKRKKTKKLSE